MATITPVIPVGTNSVGIHTPGWALASVQQSNPIAGRFATTPPDPNDTAKAALLQQALVQSGHSNDRLL